MDSASFEISPHSGFLLREPLLPRLPDRYEQWETINDVLPELLKEWKLRDKIEELPLLPVSDSWLPTERHWQRAYCVLTFLSQGYLWERGESGTVSILPQQLAIPWYETSSRCGLPPVTTYASAVLWNWSLKDPDQPISFDNLRTIFSFTGDRSEEWFYLVHQGIELVAAVGVKAAVDCLTAVAHQDNESIIENLNKVTECIKSMVSFLPNMYVECEPDYFFNRIRPFQAGSKDLVAFSGGLILEGVDTEPKKFIGASAAQSSTLPVFDILLGVEHHGAYDKQFLDMQKWHMPRPHRQFLLALSLRPSLRVYVQHHKTNEALVTAYNSCIKELSHFRSEHIKLITRYIVGPAQRQKEKNQVGLATNEENKEGASATHEKSEEKKEEGTLAERGTGGTPFMVFLKAIRDDTLSYEIK